MHSLFKYTLIAIIMSCSFRTVFAQASIFDDPESVQMIKHAADQIYGMDIESAAIYAAAINEKHPGHPINTMIEAVKVLWMNIPVLQDSVFNQFNYWLMETVAAAEKMPDDHPDAVFFEMSARGLLAEYYADRGSYMKALNEATQAYALLKEGFELSEKYPEFLFAVGLYNYFREAYPEKHPIYKPLIWFFRSGDKEKGLNQLKRATKETVIIRVEAYVYLSYIYMRYEEKPELSRKYISELLSYFPQNPYVQAKYLEAHHSARMLEKLEPAIINSLLENERPYYEMVGHLYLAIRYEQIDQNYQMAFDQYQLAAKIGDNLDGYGSYYKSLIYLGLARIYEQRNKSEAAKQYYEMALQYAETDDVRKEANRWLNR